MDQEPELHEVVRKWKAGPNTPAFDERMMARFRSRGDSFWRKRLEIRVVLPAPLVAAAMMIVIAGGLWLITRHAAPSYEPVPDPKLTVTAAEVLR
jgi:hypothetical protein